MMMMMMRENKTGLEKLFMCGGVVWYGFVFKSHSCKFMDRCWSQTKMAGCSCYSFSSSS
jgi:hypothetical protein